MKNLFKALADFQQEVPTIHKGTQGYGYSYADLPKIFEVINPLMQKHGLGFTQCLNGNDLVTIIFHSESEEKLESVTPIPLVQLKGMNDYQSFGSGITYFRRYCLSAMLGLVTDKDTDASGEQTGKKLPTLTDERFENALKSIEDGKMTAEKLKTMFTLTEKQLSCL
jgi:hypothetical protein